MPRFIALPVGSGDAFYLDRGDWSVLVDGGLDETALVTAFQQATRATSVDVLICTHNDADHANGVLGFLDSGMECKEVWLPGKWLGLLPKVLRPTPEVLGDLFNEVLDEKFVELADVPTPQMDPLEQLAEALGKSKTDKDGISACSRMEDDAPLREADGWPKSLQDQLDVAGDRDGWAWLGPEYGCHPRYLHPYHQMNPAQVRLLWAAIDAARRIQQIATSAFHHGFPVRWFEYDVAARLNGPVGGCAELEPLNAKEITRIPPVGELLWELALSVANRESLVFWSPPTDEFPGVLFNADSDLARVSLPSNLTNAISTAPHHGSEANAKAYVAIAGKENADSITWVRSDGKYRRNPGARYLSQNHRLCTICRLANGAWSTATQTVVRLVAQGGVWAAQTPVCTCVIATNLARCTAPKRGHRKPSARAACPACGGGYRATDPAGASEGGSAEHILAQLSGDES